MKRLLNKCFPIFIGLVLILSSFGSIVYAAPNANASDPISPCTRFEAESYTSQSGIQTESCSEGGEAVGYIENGDYTVYGSMNFDGSMTTFQARVASATNGGYIEIRLDSITGTLAGVCPIAGTGDWQAWTDAKCSVSGLTGKHDLYLKFTGDSGYLFNFNWFTFGNEREAGGLGDINWDTQIDAIDLQLIKSYLLGMGTIQNTKAADLDANGDVNAIDFSLMKQYLLGIIADFPGNNTEPPTPELNVPEIGPE